MSNQSDILLIGSGHPDRIRTALDMFSQHFPHLSVDLAIRPDATVALSLEEQRRVVYLAGRRRGRLSFIRWLRRSDYQMVAVLFAGDTGYNALKTMAFLCGRKRVLCCNENGDAFELTPTNPKAFLDHLLWRRQVQPSHSLWRAIMAVTLGIASRPLFEGIGCLILLGKTSLLVVSGWFHHRLDQDKGMPQGNVR